MKKYILQDLRKDTTVNEAKVYLFQVDQIVSGSGKNILFLELQ